jgi:hypothetical protein
MNQAKPIPVAEKFPSSLKLIAIIALRILGYRKTKFIEDDFARLSGTQVGFACMLALIGFTVIIALLSILAVKIMS